MALPRIFLLPGLFNNTRQFWCWQRTKIPNRAEYHNYVHHIIYLLVFILCWIRALYNSTWSPKMICYTAYLHFLLGTFLVGAQPCSKCAVPLKPLYQHKFNNSWIEDKIYVSQRTVTSKSVAQCLSKCIWDDQCVASVWRQTDKSFCQNLYSDRAVYLPSVVEWAKGYVVAYHATSSFVGNMSKYLWWLLMVSEKLTRILVLIF